MIDTPFIQFNLQSEFHMLRHFEKCSFETNEKLIAEGYTQIQIDKELRLIGSKFKPEFAENIKDLLGKFDQYSYSQSIGINGNVVLELHVPKTDFPNGIGTQAVIPINEIPEKERRFIYAKKNRNVELLHYKVNAFPTTNDCTMILKPVKNGYFFITSFPGQAAMPIPEISMDMALYTSCKKFWDNHVFLEQNL